MLQQIAHVLPTLGQIYLAQRDFFLNHMFTKARQQFTDALSLGKRCAECMTSRLRIFLH
ncbi:hypothetical protein D3C86_1754460 [compost metagenome]